MIGSDKMRKSEITRKTNETDIRLSLNIDGEGKYNINTGCGFFDHMLELFSRHSGFDLDVDCVGDTKVDFHHTVEDVGICLGKAFSQALGDMKGICRYGDIILPMDEVLIMCAVDVSNRFYLTFDVDFENSKVGDFDCELAEEFLIAFARNASITLHINKLYGKNLHHIIEGVFKALARTLAKAVAIDMKNADIIPSSKGIL